MKIAVGTSGFPVARDRYFRALGAVEISSSFHRLPRLETAKRWKEEAPEGFSFLLQAWLPISHSPQSPDFARVKPPFEAREKLRAGHFQDTDVVARAWEATSAVAEALGAKIILFKTPSSFHPSADHLRDMYRFFKRIRRGERLLAWEPRGGGWEAAVLERIYRDLGLINACDPFGRAGRHGTVHYFRLAGKREERRVDPGYRYDQSELVELSRRCEGKPSYVIFDNHAMWEDARRFQGVVDPVSAALNAAARKGAERRRASNERRI